MKLIYWRFMKYCIKYDTLNTNQIKFFFSKVHNSKPLLYSNSTWNPIRIHSCSCPALTAIKACLTVLDTADFILLLSPSHSDSIYNVNSYNAFQIGGVNSSKQPLICCNMRNNGKHSCKAESGQRGHGHEWRTHQSLLCLCSVLSRVHVAITEGWLWSKLVGVKFSFCAFVIKESQSERDPVWLTADGNNL